MRAVGVVCGVCVAAAVSGCLDLGLGPRGGDLRLDPGLRAAFAPRSLRLSPLTRVEPDAAGRPVLTVYFELLDSWGHGTKAPGLFEAQLFRVLSGVAVQQERWEADLSDPDGNSALFDVTGLYRVPLSGAPTWLVEHGGGGGSMRVRVYFRTLGPDGRETVLRDVFERTMGG